MKKANVTYEEVAAHCDLQAAKGVNPERIRSRSVIAALGCQSSTSTVDKLIDQWRAEHAQQVQDGIALTEADIGGVLKAVKFVVATKHSERDRELNALAEYLKAQLANAADDLAALMEENRRLTDRTEELEAQLTEAKATITVLQASLASLVGLAQASGALVETQSVNDPGVSIDEGARPASHDEQGFLCSPLPPEAFDGSYQDPALAPATGQAALPLSAAAGNSNKGHEEKPHAQG